MSDQPKKYYGFGAEFNSAAAVYEAAKKVRDAGFKRWDVHTPFPVHGLDEAMGLGKSPLGYFVFCGGTLGMITALCLEFLPSTFWYPLIVHGKPTNWATLPAFFPIMFELTVLLSAITAVFGMLAINLLPRWNHPLFNWDRFRKVTDDKFFIAIEARDPKFDLRKTHELLHAAGATHILLVEED